MNKSGPNPDRDASTTLRPMSVDELITAAAQRPHRYSDEWFSANNAEYVFTLTDLRKELHDLTSRHGGEWTYQRTKQQATIYHRNAATGEWTPVWHRIPDAEE